MQLIKNIFKKSEIEKKNTRHAKLVKKINKKLEAELKAFRKKPG